METTKNIIKNVIFKFNKVGEEKMEAEKIASKIFEVIDSVDKEIDFLKLTMDDISNYFILELEDKYIVFYAVKTFGSAINIKDIQGLDNLIGGEYLGYNIEHHTQPHDDLYTDHTLTLTIKTTKGESVVTWKGFSEYGAGEPDIDKEVVLKMDMDIHNPPDPGESKEDIPQGI